MGSKQDGITKRPLDVNPEAFFVISNFQLVGEPLDREKFSGRCGFDMSSGNFDRA